ncbi:MAG: HlyD family efflux transporter periplasmic adaptor subunit [Rubrivivax sp.]|nr:HlyD family efflux transporter periplasmic adaptor subunit [Rubrivivax sp.]
MPSTTTQHLQSQPTTPVAARPSRSAAVVALQSRALAHDTLAASGLAVVNELALQLGCERVTLALGPPQRLRVRAVSHAADLRPHQTLLKLLAAAMSEAIEQRAAIVHPLPPGASPTITLAHDALAQANGHTAICTMPIVARRELLGALLFERRSGFDNVALQTAKDAAMFVGPLLALQERAEAPVVGQVRQALARKRGLTPWRVALPLAAAACAVAALWPVAHQVVAPARVEGAVQRIVAAPADGFIASVAARPGDSVAAGQVLLTLDARDFALERNKWAAEMAQLDKQYRDALSRDEAAPIMVARAKLEQAQSQHELAVRQLERASLRAPMAGVVIAGELTQSVGLPVRRGQELMTIAPDRRWRIVAEVDEQDVAALRAGQRAQVLFAGWGAQPVAFDVQHIAAIATQVERRNVFEVQGQLAEGSAAAALRPGQRGVARIVVGQRLQGAIWWERARDALRRLSWRLLG